MYVFCMSVSAQSRLVGVLRSTESVDGCGCYISFSKADDKARRYIFFASDEEGNKDALMNIDGRDIRLRFVNQINPKAKIRLGSRYISRYESGNITVEVVRTIIWLCPPKDEGCEIARFSVTLTVRKGNSTQIVKAFGVCGC